MFKVTVSLKYIHVSQSVGQAPRKLHNPLQWWDLI